MAGRTAWRIVWMVLLIVAGLAASTSAQTRRDPQPARPGMLVPLYITFAGLQALDAHSTLTAVRAGAQETNPVVRGALGNTAGLILLKGGTAAAVVVLNERLWRRNRTAAVLTMVALNSAYMTIAAHNYRAQRR